MRKFLLFACLFIQIALPSQIDSLLKNLEKKPEKEQTEMLNKIAEKLSETEMEKSIEYAEKALHLAKKYKQKKEEAFAYKNLADCYFYLNQFEKSLDYYEKSAAIEKQISGVNSVNYLQRLSDTGYCQEILFRYQEALDNYGEALQIAKEINQISDIIILYNNIGQVYFKIGSYDKATEYFQQNLELEKLHGKEEDLSSVYNNIGMVYKAWEQYEKAIPYFEQAVSIDRKFNNQNRLAIRLNNLGDAYRSLEQYDKALEILQEALEIEKSQSRTERIAIRLGNLALVYMSKGDYSKALELLLEEQMLLKSIDSPELNASFYSNLGNVYGELGDTPKAIEYLLKSQAIAQEKGLKQRQLHNYYDLVIFYEKMGNYKQAFTHQRAYTSLKDSMFSEEKHKQLAEFETKYETEKKENEIVLLKKNSEFQNLLIKQQKMILFSLIGGFLFILIFVFIIYSAYKREKREISRRKSAEEELQNLNKNLEQRVETEVRIRTEQEQKAIEQSRLAALGELAAGIAHEINQPLHSIAFAIDNMSIAIEEDDADKEYLLKKSKKILEDTHRMKRIIDHIRTFSRNQIDVNSEPFCINDSILHAVNMVKEQYANHQIRLELDLADKLPSVLGNLYRFEQVALILLSNGKDAVEEKSLSENNEYQKLLSCHTFADENHVYFKLKDNGTGISKEDIDKIFNPFYTTKKPGQGTGLGLSIAYGIIGEMDGRIEVSSEEKSNTIIKITIPICKK
jgi:signal transduction histidine kinase/uncharacterized protein HemY